MLAPDEWMRSRTGDVALPRGLGGCGASLADSAVRGGRLLGRRDSEFTVEDANALSVLPERRGPLAARAVERQQPAVRGLVERIEREPPARVLYRGRRV